MATATVATTAITMKQRERERKKCVLAVKNRYDFNKWAIWMKMKMLSLVGNKRSRGRLIDEAKREKIHWTVTLASNPHEMFLMSLKKRFSANHEIPTNIGCMAQEKAISTRNGKQTTRKREWREKKKETHSYWKQAKAIYLRRKNA